MVSYYDEYLLDIKNPRSFCKIMDSIRISLNNNDAHILSTYIYLMDIEYSLSKVENPTQFYKIIDMIHTELCTNDAQIIALYIPEQIRFDSFMKKLDEIHKEIDETYIYYTGDTHESIEYYTHVKQQLNMYDTILKELQDNYSSWDKKLLHTILESKIMYSQTMHNTLRLLAIQK
jgi:hypothetical protein